MIARLDTHAPDRVHDALSDVLPTVMRTARTRWQFATSDGHRGAGVIDDDWFTLDVNLGAAGDGRSPWPGTLFNLLQWNAALPGLSKFAIAPHDRSLRLRSEIMIDGQTPYEDRIRRICTDLDSAFRIYVDRACDGGPTLEPAAAGSLIAASADIESLCREADLPVHRDVNGQLTTASAMEESVHIGLEPTAETGLRISTDLPARADGTHGQRRAVALLLLLATASVRMVRAAARPKKDRTIVSLEVEFPRTPSVAELIATRAALSIAHAQSSAEARLFQNEDLAHRYLACQGFGTPLESVHLSKKKGDPSWSQQLQTSST